MRKEELQERRLAQQVEEIEALKAIFMSDFHLLQATTPEVKMSNINVNTNSPWKITWETKRPNTLLDQDHEHPTLSKSFEILLYPSTFISSSPPSSAFHSEFKPKHPVYAILKFELPSKYPSILPLYSVSVPFDTSLEAPLTQFIQNQHITPGRIVVFDICNAARDYLDSVPLPKQSRDELYSFHDEMLQRQVDKQRNDSIKRSMELEEQERERFKDTALLDLNIEKTMNRKHYKMMNVEESAVEPIEEDSNTTKNMTESLESLHVEVPSWLQSSRTVHSPLNPALSIQTISKDTSTVTLNERVVQEQPLFASRYAMDFVELEFVGRGSFGSVVKARNRLDGRVYAIKKVHMDPSLEASSGMISKDKEAEEKQWRRMLREVLVLSRVWSRFVVRYYQAWIEQDHVQAAQDPIGLSTDASLSNEFHEDKTDWTAVSDDFIEFENGSTENSPLKSSWQGRSMHNEQSLEKLSNALPAFTLYIQMEYCEKKTLKDAIEEGISDREAWSYFRQILEGLVHIHSQGMVHRDLKPTNIFLDSQGNCKLGDFGLATQLDTSERTSVVSPINSVLELDSINGTSEDALTSDVGTSFYIAPEVIQGNRKYNQKVDVYSLGIILFELLHPTFQTKMERAIIINQLRKPNPTFPSTFAERSDLNYAGKRLITWMLIHDETKRPSSKQIVKSDILQEARIVLRWEESKFKDLDLNFFDDVEHSEEGSPVSKSNDQSFKHKNFIEDALTVLTNPCNRYFQRVVHNLFKKGEGSIDPHIDFTFDTGGTDALPWMSIKSGLPFATSSHTHALLLEYIRSTFARVIQGLYGAVYFDSESLLLPSSNTVLRYLEGKANVAKVICEDGSLTCLPHDLTMGFARYIARNPVRFMKRWSLQKVYRRNLAGGHPRMIYEADIDIVHCEHGQSTVYDAELIWITTHTLAELKLFDVHIMACSINHGFIISAIFDLLQISIDLQPRVCSVVSQFGHSKWSSVLEQLKKVAPTVSDNSWALLRSIISIRCNLSEAPALLTPLFTNSSPSARSDLEIGLQSISDLQANLSKFNYSQFGILHFDASLFYNYHYYRSGILFQIRLINSVSKHRPNEEIQKTNGYIIAGGGRYDSLIDSLKHPGLASFYKVGAVGVNIAVSKIANLLSRHSVYDLAFLASVWDVYIASFGAVSLSERWSLSMELSSSGIRSDFAHNESLSLEALVEYCKSMGIGWLVIIKSRNTNLSNLTYKMRNIHTKIEYEVLREEIADYVNQEHSEHRRNRNRTRTMSTTSNDHSRDFMKMSGQPSFNVTVLYPKSTSKGKQSGRVKQMVIEKATKSVSAFLETLGYSSHQNMLDLLLVQLKMAVLKQFSQHVKTQDVALFRKEVLDLFQASKEYLQQIRTWILERKRTLGIQCKVIFIYSLVDEDWEMVRF